MKTYRSIISKPVMCPAGWNALDKVSFRLKEAKKGTEAYDLKKV